MKKIKKILSLVVTIALVVAIVPLMSSPASAVADTGVKFEIKPVEPDVYKLVFKAMTPDKIQLLGMIFSYDNTVIKPVHRTAYTDLSIVDGSTTPNTPFSVKAETNDEVTPVPILLWKIDGVRTGFSITISVTPPDFIASDGDYIDMFEFYFKFQTGFDDGDITATTFKFENADDPANMMALFFPAPATSSSYWGILMDRESGVNQYRWGCADELEWLPITEELGEVINPFVGPELETLTVGLTAGDSQVTLAPQSAETGFAFYYTSSTSEATAPDYGDALTTISSATEYTAVATISGTNDTLMYVQVYKVETTGSTIVGFGQASATPKPTYAIDFATASQVANGVTATGTISPTGSQGEDTLITVTITLTGTATAAGTHTVGLTSATSGVTITPPATVTKAVTAGTAMTASDTFAFTFTMPADDVEDLVVTHTFAVTPVYEIELSTAPTFTPVNYGYSSVSTQTITVTNTGNQATGTLDVGLSGANSGSFTLSTDSISSITAPGTDTFTIKPNDSLNAGTYTATVTVSGDNGISESFSVSFTVNKIAPVLDTHYESDTATAGGTYNNSAKSVSVSLLSTYTGLGTATILYDGSATAPTNAGSYAVTATFVAGDNFNAVTTPVSLGTLTIGTATYSGSTPNINQNVRNGEAANLTISLLGLNPSVAGTLGDVSYTYVSLLDTNSIIYGAPLINGDELEVVVNNMPVTSAFTATINVNVETQNYGTIPATVTLTTVDKTDVSGKITFSASNAAYTGDAITREGASISGITAGLNPGWTYTYAIGSTPTSNELISGGKPLNAGNYAVTATYEDDDNIGSVTVQFTVTQISVSILSTSNYAITKEYDGTTAAGTPTGTLSLSGVLAGDTANVSVDTGTIPTYANANVQSVTLALPISLDGTASGNYTLGAVTTVNVPASITKRPLANGMIGSIANQPYTGSPITPALTVTDGSPTIIAGSDYTVSYSNNTAIGTAMVTITATTAGNYSDSASATFNIVKGAEPTATTPANIWVKASASGTFDLDTIVLDTTGVGIRSYTLGSFSDTYPILDVSPSLSGSIISFQCRSGMTAGLANATQEIIITTTNYEDCTVILTFEVTDDAIVTLSGVSVAGKTYDGAGVSYSGTLIATDDDSNIVTGDVTPVYTYSGTPNVGTFATGATAPTEAGDYVLTVTGTGTGMVVTPLVIPFTIARKTVTITGVNQSVTVGKTPAAFTASISGEVSGKELTGRVTTATCPTYADAVGTYSIIPDTSSDTSGNYTIVYVDGTLTVTNASTPTPTPTPPYYDYGGAGSTPAASTIPAGDGSVSVTYSISGGVATLNMPTAKVNEIIGKAKDGKATLNLSKVSSATAAVLPKAALTQFVDAGLGLEMVFPQGTMTLSNSALASVASQAGGASVNIALKQLKVSDLPVALRSAVKGSDLIFDISVTSGSQVITNLGGGVISVTVPYNGPLPAAVWYLNSDGELEKLVSAYDPATKTVTFVTDHLSLYVVGEDPDGPTPITPTMPVNPFSDVFGTDWFIDDVIYAYSLGLIDGTTPTTFSPKSNLTYAEAVKLAACMHQLFTTGEVTLENDSAVWYQSYVDYAKENGIISKDYNWSAPATRAGYIEIFANALPDEAFEEINDFADGAIPDVDMDHPQADAIYKLYRAGILQGVDKEYTCAPDSNILRSEVAAILARMMNPDARITF